MLGKTETGSGTRSAADERTTGGWAVVVARVLLQHGWEMGRDIIILNNRGIDTMTTTCILVHR